jgi:hypothetical protein
MATPNAIPYVNWPFWGNTCYNTADVDGTVGIVHAELKGVL